MSEYQRTWEDVKILQEQVTEKTSKVQYVRPLLRRMILVLDYSKMCLKKDLKPSRYKLISSLSERFLDLFYSCNPLSKIQVLICRNGKAYLAEDKKEIFSQAEGEFSLQNALEMSIRLMNDSGPHWSNEILVILNSLTTCDYGDLWENIPKLKENHIRISVISTCAQNNSILNIITQTGGKSVVINNEQGLRENWDEFARSGFPTISAALIPMAFSWFDPQKTTCSCHYELREGFICPICRSKVCSIPSQCPICKHFLVSAPHLTKASLSIMPLPPFVEATGVCEGCQEQGSFGCQTCGTVYCQTCQEFLQAILGKCIGCSFSIL